MTRYKFSQDRKHTIWTRTHFTIDAPTQAEAIAKAATLVGQDVEDAEAEDERISIEESETLYDTMDEIPVEDNDGNSTIDIIFDNGDDLADNVTGAVWDYWWKESDDEVLESITGLRRSDFDPADGCRAFTKACEEWWNKHSDLEKIEMGDSRGEIPFNIAYSLVFLVQQFVIRVKLFVARANIIPLYPPLFSQEYPQTASGQRPLNRLCPRPIRYILQVRLSFSLLK